MIRLGAILVPILLLALACGELATPATPLAADLEATVRAVLADTQSGSDSRPESLSGENPDIESTITARVQATVQALLKATAIPSPTPTQSGSQPLTTGLQTRTNPTRPTPTPTGIPLPTPSVTPFPTLSVGCSAAADGTEISAWVNGGLAATTLAQGGNYTLFIEPVAGRSYTGQTITFTVGGADADQTVVWVQGGAIELDLTATIDGFGKLAPNQTGAPSLKRGKGGKGGPLAQPVPPHVVLGTASIGDC